MTSSTLARRTLLAALLLLAPVGSALGKPQTTSQPTTAPSATAEDPHALYRAGCAALEAQRPSEAVALLARAAAHCPENEDYLQALSRAYLEDAQPQRAIRLLRQLQKQHPEDMTLAIVLARALDAAEQTREAVTLLQNLADKLPDEGMIVLAQIQAHAGQDSEAQRTLKTALQRRPESATLWQRAVELSTSAEQYGLALEQLGEARRQLGRLTAQLLFLEAQAYYGMDQALGETRIMRLPDGHAGEFHGNWLLIEPRDENGTFLCCGRESAMYALRRALDAGLEDSAAYRLLARIWSKAGRPDYGLTILEQQQAGSLSDAPPETLQALSELALAANKLEDHLRYVRLYAASCPEDQRPDILHAAYVAAAERYNQRGDGAMYRELLRRALEERPHNTKDMLRLADSLWDAGTAAEARTWYRRLLEHEPTHPQRSRILPRLGD